MATKLEGLHIKKVDFVDQGANQMANIKIKKSKDGEEISNPEVGLFKRFVNWITGELSKSDSEIQNQQQHSMNRSTLSAWMQSGMKSGLLAMHCRIH